MHANSLPVLVDKNKGGFFIKNRDGANPIDHVESVNCCIRFGNPFRIFQALKTRHGFWTLSLAGSLQLYSGGNESHPGGVH